MVDRIKRLGSIEEKKKALGLGNYTFKEELVNISSVVHAIFSPEEALLRGVDDGRDRRHNNAS